MMYKVKLKLLVILLLFSFSVRSAVNPQDLKRGMLSGNIDNIRNALKWGYHFESAAVVKDVLRPLLNQGQDAESCMSLIVSFVASVGNNANKRYVLMQEILTIVSQCDRGDVLEKILNNEMFNSGKINDLVTIINIANTHDAGNVGRVAINALIKKDPTFFEAQRDFLHSLLVNNSKNRAAFLHKVLRTQLKKQLNNKNSKGQTPLHIAVSFPKENFLLPVLVEECKGQQGWLSTGCSFNPVDNDNNTPLDIARKEKIEAAIVLLESHGGRCNTECKADETPIYKR